jgi:hypothetical protein
MWFPHLTTSFAEARGVVKIPHDVKIFSYLYGVYVRERRSVGSCKTKSGVNAVNMLQEGENL